MGKPPIRVSSQRTVALEALFDTRRECITAVFRALGASGHDAEDLAQEVFTRAYQSFGQLEDPDRASAWLFGIARNVRREFLRRPRTLAMTSADRLASGGTDPVSQQLETERRQAVRQAVAQLQQGFRQVVELRYADGLAYQQIAERLEISVESVGVTLFRARQKLRAQLAEWRINQ